MIERGKSPLIAPLAASHATQRKPLAMKRNLLLLLLLFVSGVLVQTAAAAAPVADAEALENEEEHDEHDEDEVAEAREEFESIDKNGDGFLERDEIMAMEEVRTQHGRITAELGPMARVRVRARVRDGVRVSVGVRVRVRVSEGVPHAQARTRQP